jgi:signal transduction histidine kinase
VDERQFGLVIENLALNARDAMPDGGTLTVQAVNAVLSAHGHASLAPGDYVRISIADQGPGIAKEVLPMIFDPYFSTKSRGVQKGMGLGLTICHAVIKNHGGAIDVTSQPGVGATVHLHLPACRAASVEQP